MKDFILSTVLILSLVAAYSYADQEGHMMGGHMDSPGYGETGESGSMSGGMMNPAKMHPGMMNPGMMGYGGCEMMNPGMMGSHQMMNDTRKSGMMGNVSAEEKQKFLNKTGELRKQLMMKRFDYGEALRNPETKAEVLKSIQKDMWEIQKKITDKWYE